MATETKFVGEYPDPNIDPNKKGKDFIMEYGKAMYHSFKNSGYTIFYNNRAEYRTLVAYAMGNQSVDQYKQRLDCWEEQDKSWINLDWQILNMCSRFVNVVQGNLNKTEANVVVSAIDPLAMDQKREFKAKVDAFLDLKQWMETIGVQAQQFFAEAPDISLDPDEKNLFLNINIKHRWSMQMEKLINKVLYDNDYKQLKMDFVWDLIVLGIGAIKITEREDCFALVQKINPENLIVSYSEKGNFKDIQHAGEVKFMTPNEFFDRAGDQFTEEEKKDIINKYAKIRPRYNHSDGRNATMYNNMGEGRMIEVLDFNFLSCDTMVHEKKKDKRGNPKLYRKNFNYPSNGEEYNKKYEGEREVLRTKYDAAYKGLWIIGSDYICDYGRVENALLDDYYDNCLPYVIVAPNIHNGRTASLVKQMVPVLNYIQINWLKHNDAIAKYIPKGANIDLDALEDVAIGKGGKNMTKREIIEMYFKRGILVGRRKNMANKGSNGLAIQELENGMSRDVVTFFNNILNGINLLRSIIGVNEITDASTPDPKMLKSLAEAATVGTNNALDFLYSGLNLSFEYLCQNLSYSIVGAIKRGVDDNVDESVGDGTLKFFGDNSDITMHKYGIKIENKPTKDEWAGFQQEIAIALEQGMILPSDAAFIREIDNLKQARQYLIVRERRKMQMDAEQQQASIQATAQAQQQSAASASQMKLAEITAEYQGKAGIEDKKVAAAIAIEEEKRKTLELQYNLELRNSLEKIKLEGTIKSALGIQTAHQDLLHETMTGELKDKSQV